MVEVSFEPGYISDISADASGWLNQQSAYHADGTYAHADLARSGSHSKTKFLHFTNFGCNIPTNATITGIEVHTLCHQSGTAQMVRFDSVQFACGSKFAELTSKTYITQNNSWYMTVPHLGSGLPSGLTGITPADLNNGLTIDILFVNANTRYTPTVYVDTCQLYVTYSVPGGTEPNPGDSDDTNTSDVEVLETSWYGRGLRKPFAGTAIDVYNDDLRCMLVTDTYKPAQDHLTLADVTGEASGTGYTAGGVSLSGVSVSLDPTVPCLNFYADEISLSAVSTTFKHLVIYDKKDGTTANTILLLYVTFKNNVTVSNEPLSIKFNINGFGLITLNKTTQ